MKKDKDKSKKSHESTIGKIIYGFLLFLPLFAIGTTCLISTFNMSTKEESEIIYKYETNEVNSTSDLIEGNIYKLSLTNESLPTDSKLIAWVNDIYIDSISIIANFDKINNYQIRVFATNTGISCTLYTSENVYVKTIFADSLNNINDINFVYQNYGNADYINYINNTDFNVIDRIETHNLNAEEVFYNSIDKIQQSPLFNWTTNSLLYTGMNEFTTSLSITTPFIPLLLTYWLIISVVYFLYDIVLVILTVLHRKIHNLQDSI